jgi:hypothetical protein
VHAFSQGAPPCAPAHAQRYGNEDIMDGYDIWLELLEKGIYKIYPDGTILKIRRNKGTGEKTEPKEEKNRGRKGYRVLGIKYKGKMYTLLHHKIVWYTYRRIKPSQVQKVL